MNNPKTEEIVEALRCRAHCNACTEDCICYSNKDFDCVSNFTVLTTAADRLEVLEVELAALKEKQRWIPVTERLPEDDGQVYAYWSGDVFSAYYCPRTGFYSSETGHILYDVTHWMPLPEPPMEDKNESNPD